MRKALLAISILVATGTATAEYTVKVPLEQNQGGSLPSGTISIKNITPQAPIENWMPTTPFYTEWVNDGEPFDCTNWSPDPSTVAIGETFSQTATDCSQDQTRTAQDQEVETISGIVRDKGNPYNQQRTITASSTRDSVGTLMPSWEQFASDKGLSKNWKDPWWHSKGLSYLPNAPYPLTSVNNLYLYDNQLTNVDGLSNITSVGGLYLYDNQLENVNGLANMRVFTYIMVDATYSGPKLAANTRFCTLNINSVFLSGYAKKSQLCESP